MKCLKTLSISQLVKLSQRFNLNPQYKNPRKRKAALIRSLRDYWKTNSIGECSICWEEIQPKKLCVTPCAHLFCNECLIPYVRESEKCPLCRAHCSYTYLVNKMFKVPELVAFLKTLINVPRREEWAEEVFEEPIDDPPNIIYHINIYIVIQRGLENVHSFITIFFTIFAAYYFYLIIRKGLHITCFCIHFATMFCILYYMVS